MKKICSFFLIVSALFLNPHSVVAAQKTTLSITSTSSTYTPQTTFYTDIVIDTDSSYVVSSDIILNFNPAVLEAIDAQTGSFLASSSLITENLDNTNGKVTVSLFTHKENARQGIGTLARIRWRAKNVGSTTISFDTQKTLIYGLQEGNVLTATEAKQISVSNSVSTSTTQSTPTQTTILLSPTSTETSYTEGTNGFVTYGKPLSQQSGPDTIPLQTSSTETILPSTSQLNSSVVEKFVATIQDIFTPRGNGGKKTNPNQTPIPISKTTDLAIHPILFVWIIGVLIVCGGAALYFVKFRKKKPTDSSK